MLKSLALVVVVSLTFSVSACRTPDAADPSTPQSSGGTTVGNGHIAPLAIVVHYASAGAGIDTATKRAVDAQIADAKRRDLLVTTLDKSVGPEGEHNTCLQFKKWEAMQGVRKAICDAIKAGNARVGAALTSHQIALKCTPELVEKFPGGTNDQGC